MKPRNRNGNRNHFEPPWHLRVGFRSNRISVDSLIDHDWERLTVAALTMRARYSWLIYFKKVVKWNIFKHSLKSMRSKGFGVNLKQRLGWGSNHGTRYSQTDGLTITLLMCTNQSQIIETIFFLGLLHFYSAL